MEVFGGGRGQRGRSLWDGPVGPPKVLVIEQGVGNRGSLLLVPLVLGFLQLQIKSSQRIDAMSSFRPMERESLAI